MSSTHSDCTRLPWLLTTALGCLCLGSCCANQPRTAIIEFKDLRISLHVHAVPVEAESVLHAEGPGIQTREEVEHALGDFIVTGVGIVTYGTIQIFVSADSLRIGDTIITNDAEYSRNIILERDGTVTLDAFLPFEPWWGHHRF